jgi:Uma2 family endonuclease
MNEHVRLDSGLRDPTLSPTTQAAEGLMRRRWSVAEIEAMVEAGIILPDERFELIGGEVVPMPAKGNQHEMIKTALMYHWSAVRETDIRFTTETTFRLSKDTFLEPDFTFYPAASGIPKLSGENAVLAVEVSDTTLGYDLGRKARLYALFGIRELWVMDAVKLETHVHTRPGIEGYRDIRVAGPNEVIAPSLAPELAVSLGKLELI